MDGTYDAKPGRDRVAGKGFEVEDGGDEFIECPMPGVRLDCYETEGVTAKQSCGF